LAGKRGDIFWRTHCKNKEGGEAFFSDEFKDLIENMLKLEPCQRPTISQIMQHPWMQGETPSKEEVLASFVDRDQIVKQQIQADKAQKDAEKAKLQEQHTQKVMRSGSSVDKEKLEQMALKPQK